MKHLLLQFALMLAVSWCFGQSTVVGYEYWFDQGFSSKVENSISPTQSFTFDANISTTGLSTGIHSFNFRTYDANGLFSVVLSQYFYKVPESGSSSNNLVAYEYWFDEDYANAQVISSVPQQQIDLTTIMQATGFSFGIHTLNIRFKDQSGLWSGVLSQYFYKVPESVSSTNNIVAYEYWFDGDYANVERVNTPVQKTLNVNDLLNTSVLNVGIHSFQIRFLDEAGLWSSIISEPFYKTPEIDGGSNWITDYRYWLNNDFSAASHVKLTTPQKQFTLVDQLDFTQIPKDTYTINYQFKDSAGFWSVVLTDTIVKTPLPIPDFSADTTLFCDGGLVSFTNTSIDGDTYLWDFGDGGNSTDQHATHTYTQPGVYSVSLTAFDLSTPVDSTVIVDQLVVIYETPSSVISVIDNDTICAGSSSVLEAVSNVDYQWNTGSTDQQITVAVAGDYWASLTNPTYPQCSTNSDTITLEVMDYPNGSLTLIDNDTICAGTTSQISATSNALYLWSNGSTTQDILVSTTDSYWVTLSNPDFPLCSLNSDTVQIQVMDYPDGTLTIMDNDTICAGTTSQISATSNALYLWSDGSTTQNLYASTTDSYWVTLSNPDFPLCSLNSDTVQITTMAIPSLTISLNNNDTICENDEVELFLNSGYDYLWSTGASTSSIITGQTGAYWVTVYNPDFSLCFAQTDTVEIVVIDLPTADFSFFNNEYEVSFTNLSTDASGYFWDFGDGITGVDIDPVHVYGSNQNYNSYLVAYNSCGSDTSYQSINLIYLSRDLEMETMEVNVFPNPAIDHFILSSDFNYNIGVQMTIFDETGKIVQQKIMNGSDANYYYVDISNFSTGVYQVVIGYDSHQFIQKLVVLDR
ncbi:MAG: PKD domain-containing protein [Flavobacteriales bacterium]|nr:PKD domain-containing protein [Flavobacteriales bacterium]